MADRKPIAEPDWGEDIPLSKAQCAALDQRLNDLEGAEVAGMSWEQVAALIRGRRQRATDPSE